MQFVIEKQQKKTRLLSAADVITRLQEPFLTLYIYIYIYIYIIHGI